MNTHKNARLTFARRFEMVQDITQRGVAHAVAAMKHGVSMPTVRWTLLGTPSMTLPTHRGPNGLPVGVQLVSGSGTEDTLFRTARWVWQVLY